MKPTPQDHHSHHHKHPGVILNWARLYDMLVNVLFLGREKAAREHMLDLAKVGRNDKVLDVGCGTGTLALAAVRRVGGSGAVSGIDAAPAMIKRAQRKAQRLKLPVSFQTAAAQELPFADASFSVVLLTLALHHLPDDNRAQALREIHRVLKPGGRLLIVEIGGNRRPGNELAPVTLLHGRRAQSMLDEAVQRANGAGLKTLATGPLGYSALGYVLARKE